MEPGARPTESSGSSPLARTARILLYLAALAVLVAVILQGRRFAEQAVYLRADGGANSLISLQLSTNTAQALRIVTVWGANGSLGCAIRNLDLDVLYIILYAAFGVLVALVALASVPAAWRSKWLMIVLVGLPLLAPVAGLADHFENQALRQQIVLAAGGSLNAAAPAFVCPPTAETVRAVSSSLAGTSEFTAAVRRARFFALLKFSLLIFAGAGALMLAGILIVRFRTRRSNATDQKTRSFEELIKAELRVIEPDRPEDLSLRFSAGTSGEPCVSYRNSEAVGLGLSGGGIRSATFNLGLLQGLARMCDGKLLAGIDYLATVSGGGYIGGAWSAFRSRDETRAADPGRDFFIRTDEPGGKTGSGDTEPVRHLREFSNFLVPRWGFFSVEMWQAIVVIVGGLVPSLLIASSVIVLVLLVYAASASHAAILHSTTGVLFTTLVAALVFVIGEADWRRMEPKPVGAERANRRQQNAVHLITTLLALGVLALLLFRWTHTGAAGVDHGDRWAQALGIGANVEERWWTNLQLLDSAFAVAATALIFVALRFVLLLVRPSGNGEPVLLAFDRTLMRMIGLATVFAALAAVWHVGVNFQRLTAWLLALLASAGGAFALLRNWLTNLQKPQSPGLLDRIKPFLPMILAYVTIVLAGAVFVSLLVTYAHRDLDRWLWAGAAAVGILTIGLFLDPQSFGMHAFYRDRIARAYLGASNPLATNANGKYKAESNRNFYVRPHDDVALGSLRGRPLHLVCCAANDLAGDPVASLSQGAQSAVLSQQGVSLKDAWGPPGDLSLASALTASAAAFNSNMGRISVTLGPAVTFLMAALNLRLGMWVRHPATSRDTFRAMPGFLYYLEMFHATAVQGRSNVHLSDGAHFDNLGLYELVRRHCRYIIISDASADPDVAFDDFGIAARKIRQDFGVDIQIDLGPLKPENGYSRQHMVVGSIEYGSIDKGILLYIKPTLTGDEEPDIRQYQRRNALFPHESTGDQFYDEAQWESYRRLGNHVAETAFRYLNRLEAADPTARVFFTEARREWYPTSPDLATRVIAMTSRLTALEGDLRKDEAASIAREVFPELAAIVAPPTTDAPAAKPTPAEIARTETLNLSWLLGALQLMEDTWVHCDLDTQWNHPLNLGWMNAFARWATTPTFQMWWPVLSPMYGSGFLRFMRERFPVLKSLSYVSGVVKLEGSPVTAGIARNMWPLVLSSAVPSDRKVFSYTIELIRGSQRVPLQVGLAAIEVSGDVARWDADQFFILPSLRQGGLESAFLSKLLEDLENGTSLGTPVRRCHVTISQEKTDPAARAEQLAYIDFYQPEKFALRPSSHPKHDFELVRKLGRA